MQLRLRHRFGTRMEGAREELVARALYASRGFTECGPFGTYVLDPNSVFMTRIL